MQQDDSKGKSSGSGREEAVPAARAEGRSANGLRADKGPGRKDPGRKDGSEDDDPSVDDKLRDFFRPVLDEPLPPKLNDLLRRLTSSAKRK